MFQFGKKDNDLVYFLDNLKNRNNYIVSIIENNIIVLTISKIKKTILPILNKYGIIDFNLFGSYARGEANSSSDIDIYCDSGNIKNLIDKER